jgi:hypothetical protein
MLSRGDPIEGLTHELLAVCEGRTHVPDLRELASQLEASRRCIEHEWSEEGRARAAAIHRKLLASGQLFNTLEHDSPEHFGVESRVARWAEVLGQREASLA